MEIERTTPDAAAKLRSTVRAAFLVLKKGFSKGKAILHLHVLLKHAGKAFRNLILEHYSAVSCRSDESLSFVSPREYEFSCSNSPAYPASMLFHKRNHRQRLRKSDVSTLATVKRFLDMLDDDASSAGEPPSPAMQLPGFGKSPMVRQLRITDSPFPVNYDGDSHVDTAAEEFIKNFYRNLRSQKGSVESPYAYHRGLLS